MENEVNVMNDRKELWKRIEEYDIDDPDSEYPFSNRLAVENNWTIKFSLRVIEEYKRFMYLACISNQPVTPSDQVDQAWHLHLIYSRQYWIEFCGQVLKKEIHHGPTPGGEKANETYNDWYSKTLELYNNAFQEEPPNDIWYEPKKRFEEINFRRVNVKRNWIIPKIRWN